MKFDEIIRTFLNSWILGCHMTMCRKNEVFMFFIIDQNSC